MTKTADMTKLAEKMCSRDEKQLTEKLEMN